MRNYCNEIAALFGEFRKLPRITADTDRNEKRRIHALQADIHRQQRDLQLEAAREFATLNGWRYTERTFSIKTLARGGTHATREEFSGGLGPLDLVDHGVYFRETCRPYRPVAVVGQPYSISLENGTQLARAYGLELHAPPNLTASWWYPNWTRCFCLTCPGTAVRFLPDQLAFEPRFPDDSAALQHAE
jgi:hypothetical protein